MGKKKVIVTTTEEREQAGVENQLQSLPPVSELQLTPEQQELNDDIQGFISGVGMPSAKVKVYKMDPAKTVPIFMGTSVPSLMTEEYIQESWGEGRYNLRLLDESGNYIKSKVVYVGPGPKKPEPSPAFQALSNPDRDRASDLQFELLRSELAAGREMMLKMIEAISGRGDNRSNLAELAGVIEVVKGLTAKDAPDPAATLSGFVEVFKQGIELGQSGGTPEKGWSGMLKDVVTSLPGVFAMLKTQTATPGNGATPPTPKVPASLEIAANPALVMAQRGISVLKAFARAGNDPATWVEVLVQNLNDPQWQPLIPLLGLSYDEVGKLDPELLNPVYRSWFERLFNGIREAVSEIGDSGGAGGHGSDADKDGGSGPVLPVPSDNP
jgi:hypothetical protein